MNHCVILLFLFKQWKCEKTISTYLTNIDVSYMTTLNYDEGKMYRSFDIKMDIGFSYVNQRFPEHEGRTHVGDMKVDVYRYHNTSAKIYLEEIGFRISKETLKSFYYLQCDSITSENSISLAHKFIDDRYSIVSQLYNQKLIDSRKFSFYIDTLFSGQLLFGDIPHNISNIFKYKITLPVDINEIKWKSNLKSVMYLNNEYDNKDEIYFDSAISNIMAPFSFFSEYNDKVMKDFIFDNICNMETMGDQVRYKCQCRGLNNFPSIDFVFKGNIKFHFEKEDLFLNYTDVCYFRIENNFYDKHQWIFGLPVLKKYIIEFDYTNEVINFYSKLPFNSINGNTIQRNIYIIISLTLLIEISYDRLIHKYHY